VRDTADPLDPTGAARRSRSDSFDRYVVAEYRARFAHDRAGITARVYGQQFVRNLYPLQVLDPSPQVVGGLAFDGDFTSYRAGGEIDGDAELARGLRLLYGGEAFREWEPGSNTQFLAPQDLTRLPLLCPRTFDATTMTLVPEPGCPLVFAYPASRSVFGAYVDPQWRPNKQLIFDAGARLQVAPASLGTLSYPAKATFAGTVVWNFLPNWHAKLNYAQGFRPPVFNDTSSNGEAVQIGGNPNLSVETSDALQAEINARILHGERRIRELAFRVDASYTRLNDLIQVTEGNYQNSGQRGIASVEFLGNLYVQGGHRLELGYTYLNIDTADKGPWRALPEHWFDIATVFDLIDGKLTATTDLRIVGASEDANRLVEYRGSSVDAMGNVVNPVSVAATDLVLDRLPPIAQLSLGATWTPTKRLSVRAEVYDALLGHYYQPDAFFDYEPHLEYLPNPYEGFRAYVSALYHY
jgi:outer membrane receptor protein involved in Fe transport